MKRPGTIGRQVPQSNSPMTKSNTLASLLLWALLSSANVLAKDVIRPPASTNLNHWESIDYPGIRLAPELADSNAWVNVRIGNSSIGLFMGVTSYGESAPFSTRDGSLAVRLHRPNGEIIMNG